MRVLVPVSPGWMILRMCYTLGVAFFTAVVFALIIWGAVVALVAVWVGGVLWLCTKTVCRAVRRWFRTTADTYRNQ